MVSNGLVNTINLKTARKSKYTKEQVAKIVKQNQEKDSEEIVGIFKNLEHPGRPISFVMKLYPGEPIKQYTLEDGQRYSLPKGVWKYLATQCYVPKYKHMDSKIFGEGIQQGANPMGRLAGNMVMSHKDYRFAFQSLEFMSDDEEISPSKLTTATYEKPANIKG